MKIISFYSDKGGTGKTFITSVVSNYFVKNGFDVVIIDVVKGRRGIYDDRKLELELAMISYPEYIVPNNPRIIKVDSYDNLVEISESISCDYMFFDLSARTLENMMFLMCTHYIFYISQLKEYYKDERIIKEVINIGNKYEIKTKCVINFYDEEIHKNLFEELPKDYIIEIPISKKIMYEDFSILNPISNKELEAFFMEINKTIQN